jgi:hypothetical protein
MNKPLPERCLRGLRDKDQIDRDPNGANISVLGNAFWPSWKSRDDRVYSRRKSDHYESSINWEDHAAESFKKLCEERKNAEYGIVSIRLVDLERAKQVNPLAAESLDWERDRISGNPFHGNLLFSGNLSRPVVRELAAVVASHVRPNLILIEPEKYEAELAARATQTATDDLSDHPGFWRRLWQRGLTRMRAVFRV